MLMVWVKWALWTAYYIMITVTGCIWSYHGCYRYPPDDDPDVFVFIAQVIMTVLWPIGWSFFFFAYFKKKGEIARSRVKNAQKLADM